MDTPKRARLFPASRSHFDGLSADQIRRFQREANDIGVPLMVDGIPGRNTRRWVGDFQRGWAGGRNRRELLAIDGILGPITMAAHTECAGDRGHTSPNFRFAEFRTQNPDRRVLPDNPVIRLNRDLVLALEEVRSEIRRPMSIVSGFRDTVWNRIVGGSPMSEHLHGNAADLDVSLGIRPRIAYDAGARGLGQVGSGDTGIITHMDMRSQLTRWQYVGSGTRSLPSNIPMVRRLLAMMLRRMPINAPIESTFQNE